VSALRQRSFRVILRAPRRRWNSGSSTGSGLQVVCRPVALGCGGGRCCCRLSSVAVPSRPHDSAAVAGVGSVGHLRPAGVHQPRPLSTRPDRRCPGGRADLSRNPAGVRRTGHRGSVRCASGIAAGCWPDGRDPPRTRPRLPIVGRGHGRRRRRNVHARPAGSGSGHRPPHAVSTAAAAPRRGRLSGPGCPPPGVLPQPADTAAVSAVVPELRPPGDAVRTAGVRRGHRRRLRGGRGYRKRSPARRPLDGCRHRREAWASWRPSRSPSWPRT
jgi:hypothetical protein